MVLKNAARLLVAIALVGSLTCWASLWPALFPLYRALWPLQLANSYSPFTAWEAASPNYFGVKVLYTIRDDRGSELSVDHDAFMESFKGVHMATVGFRMAPVVLFQRRPLHRYAEDLLRFAACEEPRKHFGYAGSGQVVSLRVLKKRDDIIVGDWTIRCGNG